jgi:ubiquinone/menaquinone biosynthesis C-methylase UbiE
MQLIMALKRGGKETIDAEIAALDLRNGDAVLDYGCGPGYNTIPATKQVGPRGKVLAVDVTPEALKVVNKKAAAQQLTNIATRLTDCDTGLDNASVDAVFLHNVLPMTERPKDVLNEIARVLKSGGKLSYKSGGGVRMAARNTMTDAEVGAYLEQDLGFTVKQRSGGHIVFTR